MAELKPCPFCGRIPIVDDCGDNRFFVRCKCGITQDKLYGQRCDAVKRWNTRYQQPEQAIKDCRNCKHGIYNDFLGVCFCYNCHKCTEWNLWEPK